MQPLVWHQIPHQLLSLQRNLESAIFPRPRQGRFPTGDMHSWNTLKTCIYTQKLVGSFNPPQKTSKSLVKWVQSQSRNQRLNISWIYMIYASNNHPIYKLPFAKLTGRPDPNSPAVECLNQSIPPTYGRVWKLEEASSPYSWTIIPLYLCIYIYIPDTIISTTVYIHTIYYIIYVFIYIYIIYVSFRCW